MRNLIAKDIFTLSRIIRKMNLKSDLKNVVNNVTCLNEEDPKLVQKTVSVDLAMIFIENIGEAEEDVYKFIADVSESTPEDIKSMDIPEFLPIIHKIVNQEGLQNLLKTVANINEG